MLGRIGPDEYAQRLNAEPAVRIEAPSTTSATSTLGDVFTFIGKRSDTS